MSSRLRATNSLLQPNTKWLDFNKGDLVFHFAPPGALVAAYDWTTGNDCPGRDPLRWQLDMRAAATTTGGDAAEADWVPLHAAFAREPCAALLGEDSGGGGGEGGGGSNGGAAPPYVGEARRAVVGPFELGSKVQFTHSTALD